MPSLLARHSNPVFELGGIDRDRRRLVFLLGFSTVLSLSLFLLFLAPARTFSALYTHDAFVFYDAIHRIGQGKIPSRDFSTPLGALSFYLPYIAYRLLGQYAGSVELASFLLMVPVLLGSSFLLFRRVSLLVGVLVLAGLGGVVMVPVNLGEVGDNVSVAMFYNRWGWAGVAVLFLLGLAPRDSGRSMGAFDATVIAALLVFLFFLKATYFAVALAFVILFGLVFRLFVRPALIGLALWFAITLGVELATGIVSANLGDLHQALKSSSTVRSHIASNVLRNAAHYGMLLLAYLYAARIVRFSFDQIAFGGFVVVSGTWLLNQNFQVVGVFPLVVLFAQLSVLVQQARRVRPGAGRGLDLPLYLPPFLLVAFTVPLLFQWGLATYHFRSLTQCQACQAGLPRMEGFYVGERFIKAFDIDPGSLGPLEPAEGRPQEPKLSISQLAYVATLRSGVVLLKANMTEHGSTMTFDLASPFNLLLDLPTATGGYLWVDFRRNVDFATAIRGPEVFQNVDYIMVPKFPANPNSRDFLLKAYRKELDRAFGLVAENEHWRLFRRSP